MRQGLQVIAESSQRARRMRGWGRQLRKTAEHAQQTEDSKW